VNARSYERDEPAESDDLLDPRPILIALQKQLVDFIVIGGVAAQLHGDPYPTRGLDLTPRSDLDNLRRLASALRNLGAREWTPGFSNPTALRLDRSRLEQPTPLLLHSLHGQITVIPTPHGHPGGYPDLTPRTVRRSGYATNMLVANVPDLISSYQASGWRKHGPRCDRLQQIHRRLLHDGPLDPYEQTRTTVQTNRPDPHVALEAAGQLARLFDDTRPALAYARRALIRAADQADYGDPTVSRQHLAAARAAIRDVLALLPAEQPESAITGGRGLISQAHDELIITSEILLTASHPSGRRSLRDQLIEARLHTATADTHLEHLQLHLERTARSWTYTRDITDDTGRS
jgi:hypothetical protein